MDSRSKETIPVNLLLLLAKEKLKQPNSDHYLHEDLQVVIAMHVDFLEAVAGHTPRINACSVALVARDLFQMGKNESHQFGSALASAFSVCMRSGSKAKTGEKLSKEVVRVWEASAASGGKNSVKKESKKEAKLKQEPAATLKRERASSPPRPSKSLKVCLSSPSQIRQLYAGTLSSSSRVKVEHLGTQFLPMAHPNTQGATQMSPSYLWTQPHPQEA
jgi:hypothetical protein